MTDYNEQTVKTYILDCLEEAKQAKSDRMDLNRNNYAMYQLEHDFSHKKEGQSTEILAKVRMAVEQTKSFFQQSLTDLGEWWKVEARSGADGIGMPIRPEEMQKLQNYMMTEAKFYSHVGDLVQSGLLGALSISKVGGCLKPKPKFRLKTEGRGKNYSKKVVSIDDKSWSLEYSTIRQENYYPDPTGGRLYEIEDYYIDMHIVKQLSQGKYALYDKSAVDQLQPYADGTDLSEQKKSLETGQNTITFARPRIKITEFLGTIVDKQTGDVLYENVIVTLANDNTIIRKPTPNTNWHQQSSIVAAALIEVANSVWGVALADAGTLHNRALVELYNLIVDGCMDAVHGIKQLRVDALQNPAQISNGIKTGDTLMVNSSLGPGVKVIETVTAGQVPQEALPVFNLIMQEFNTSMLTSDLRSGGTPFRDQKATAVVEQSNTITSTFQGMAKNFEANLIQPILERTWMTICQNWDLIDPELFVSLFGRERGEQLSQLAPQEVFVSTVNGVKFNVFGITLTLSRISEFNKLVQLLQTISGSEVLIEEFIKKYSFEKYLGEIMSALNIDKKKLEIDQIQQQLNAQPAQPDPMAASGAAPGAMPNTMSQVPAPTTGSMSEVFGRAEFPGSPATAQ